MRHWDLVLADPLDGTNMITGKESKWFCNIYKEANGNEAIEQELFQALPVTPLTYKQNTPEWFLLRTFSCTSSTTDNLLSEAKKN
jgi:hypothetical protein